MTGSDITPLNSNDVSIVQWVLYGAATWDKDPNIPPAERALQHPQLLIYHAGWGRHGDVGVKATVDGRTVGGAFARLFTDEEHGHGFVDPTTPELAVYVDDAFQRRGIGRALMNGLSDAARTDGVGQLALSVHNTNPAKRLYESLGYELLTDDDEASVMVLDLTTN